MGLTKEEENKIRTKLYKLGYLGDEVHLDRDINYIVSGLERSGTSLMMQILNAAGIPMEYNNERPPDKHNPNGYFELFGGKIINKLINGDININLYKGKFIKITSYGLKYIPKDFKYKIIYMKRNVEEILDSMEIMTGAKDQNRRETKELLMKLQNEIEDILDENNNINYITINYNQLLSDPSKTLYDICKFLGIPDGNVKRMAMAIDQTLYKERRK